ncbi:hypothetical protein KSB_61920 [Ktedonobacter robiniae]|uniref:Uncharacterized protein n=1 Tax=Ktedonobacter robiniae TaxID=2778365 RepID=A0ABQ3UZD8_9CHLR|nr:hypothetical protein KSB_61920 [Ktedonobacter robiniae]
MEQVLMYYEIQKASSHVIGGRNTRISTLLGAIATNSAPHRSFQYFIIATWTSFGGSHSLL